MKQLSVTFEGPRVAEDGVPVAALVAALEGIQDAMRLMVEHLGDRQRGPGQPPKWIRDQSRLRLAATRPGSFVAELVLEPPPDGRAYLDNFGPQALDTLQSWDGSEDSTLPKAVTDRLYTIPSALPDDTWLWLGGVDDRRRVEIKRRDRGTRPGSEAEEALLHGWLKEVNWDKRTAQLHQSAGGYVSLRFDEPLDKEMLGLATQYVEVRGRGRFDKDGDWTTVHAEQLSGARSWREPFDVDAFLNDSNPKIFDPEKVVTASEPFDVDEFIRAIHEGRDVGREGLSDW